MILLYARVRVYMRVCVRARACMCPYKTVVAVLRHFYPFPVSFIMGAPLRLVRPFTALFCGRAFLNTCAPCLHCLCTTLLYAPHCLFIALLYMLCVALYYYCVALCNVFSDLQSCSSLYIIPPTPAIASPVDGGGGTPPPFFKTQKTVFGINYPRFCKIQKTG